MIFEIEVEGTGRKVYEVAAVSEDEARQLFEAGLVAGPIMTEIVGAEITAIQKVEYPRPTQRQKDLKTEEVSELRKKWLDAQ